MKIFVAGATGVVGRKLVPRLLGQDHDVTGIARNEDAVARLNAAGARPVAISLFDAAAVQQAVHGHDAVINVATHIPTGPGAGLRSAWRENDRIREEGSRNLVAAALHADAQVYIQESITFLYADHGAEWISEEAPIQAEFQLFSAVAAEQQAARFSEHGGRGIALRFGLFHDDSSAHSQDAARMLRKGYAPTFGRADAYLAMLMVDDVVTAIAAALTAPAGLYNVVDDEPLTRSEYLEAAAAALGVRQPKAVPEAVGKLPRVRVLARSQRVSNNKFKQATGWAPAYPSAREAWKTMAANL